MVTFFLKQGKRAAKITYNSFGKKLWINYKKMLKLEILNNIPKSLER